MDYYYYSQYEGVLGYTKLRLNFDGITDTLRNKLAQFEKLNFSPDKGYMMGQSFGSQVIIDAGRKFDGKLAGIDGENI